MKSRQTRLAGTYLNVDLEIRSRFELAPLVKELSKSLFVLHTGREARMHFASFEVASLEDSPDLAIREMAHAIMNLSSSSRDIWKSAADRTFDIGSEQLPGRRPYVQILEPETIDVIAKLRGRVKFTLYPAAEHRVERTAAR